MAQATIHITGIEKTTIKLMLTVIAYYKKKKDSIFNRCCMDSRILTSVRMKLDLCVTLHEINSNRFRYDNVRPET